MILISPFSKALRNGGNNPKSYPYWKEFLKGLNGQKVVQIGVEGEEKLTKDFRKNLPFKEIEKLIQECDIWVSVDNFLPHMAHHLKKPGIVLFGQSDPKIYGYPENQNLLADRKYLRTDQFLIWEQAEYIKEAFVSSDTVLENILKLNDTFKKGQTLTNGGLRNA
jgi:ADP-heptose:LPS heptosyltransferase